LFKVFHAFITGFTTAGFMADLKNHNHAFAQNHKGGTPQAIDSQSNISQAPLATIAHIFANHQSIFH
jgi:hypothetical protein